MKTLKSRQRGHGDYRLVFWILSALPYIVGVIVLAVAGLAYYLWRK